MPEAPPGENLTPRGEEVPAKAPAAEDNPKKEIVPKGWPIARVERQLLVQLQKKCEEFGPYYCYHSTDKNADGKKKAVAAYIGQMPRRAPRATAQGVISLANQYVIVDEVSYRIVHTVDGNELRICAPTGEMRQVFAVVQNQPMSFRRELFFHYHNGPFGKHVGREQTFERLRADWFWKTLRKDAYAWVSKCEHCRGNSGVPFVSAWTRTTLYSCPFRALQFDIVTCPKDTVTGYEYVLTVICLFSRWCWAIPLASKDASVIGAALIRHVLGPWMLFPQVLRSDNAREFLSKVITYVNQKLEVDHITGATYHPQSQGAVERMHRTINSFMRGLIESTVKAGPRNWTDWLPFVEGHLRAQSMSCLGGRCPFEVVMGIKPKLPQTLLASLPVESVSVDDYVKSLMTYLVWTHDEVHRQAKELAQETEGQQRGVGEPYRVGDTVLRRRPRDDQPKGQTRFDLRTDGHLYRIHNVCGKNTYEIERLDGKLVVGNNGMPSKISAELLVKLDMPDFEFSLADDQPTRLEIQDQRDQNIWHKATFEKFLSDGKVILRFDKQPAVTVPLDLTKERYRWLYSEVSTTGTPSAQDAGRLPGVGVLHC